MANNYFKFKKFTVHQDGSAMKVGTDGVLLGAWASVQGAGRILDVGTGSGLIAMMMAQRTDDFSIIDALEIEGGAYQQAVDNIQSCPWFSRINAIHQSFQDYYKCSSLRYHHIVSNPPFFLNGVKAPDESRNKARHSDYLPFEQLLQGAKKLLTPQGLLSVILPVEEGELFIRLAGETGFYMTRQAKILPNPGKAPKRYLMEFSLINKMCITSAMAVENGQRHHYTPEYVSLTKDFYLNF